jgi:hypothetical protein
MYRLEHNELRGNVETKLSESWLEDLVDERFRPAEEDEGVVAGGRENVFEHRFRDASLRKWPVLRTLRENEVVAETVFANELLQLLELSTAEDVGFGLIRVNDVELGVEVERVVDDAAKDLEDGSDAWRADRRVSTVFKSEREEDGREQGREGMEERRRREGKEKARRKGRREEK